MATEQHTGNNPAEDDPTEREYEVIVVLRLTKRIDSSAVKIDDDLDRMEARIKTALDVGMGYTLDFTEVTAEAK
ncbi:MAG: hypothetical protein E6Q97_18965 [Desulfurellales bacterium]|nr:MAG: hypothetical protein E6Q97_18965 [Desulfurellales bacterium]